ncbi:MAG: thioredoxin [Planctomycetota bacterium]
MTEHKTIELNSANFEKTLSTGVALVDFWAAWCGPCQAQGPIVEEIAREPRPGVTIAKVDVDAENELARRFAVMSIPTLVIFKDGREVERFIGVQDKSTLLTSLEKASQAGGKKK